MRAKAAALSWGSFNDFNLDGAQNTRVQSIRYFTDPLAIGDNHGWGPNSLRMTAFLAQVTYESK